MVWSWLRLASLYTIKQAISAQCLWRY